MRTRSGLLVALVALAGCGSAPPPPTTVSQPTAASEAPGFVVLPAADELVPVGVASTTRWISTSSLPPGFDPDASHPAPEALAEAFAAAMADSQAGGIRPRWEIEEVIGQEDGRAVVVLSELGAGDDSVAGSQYAIVVRSDDAGWVLDSILARALCRRGGDEELCV